MSHANVRVLLAAAAAALLVLLPGVGRGDVVLVSDDFNDNSLDPAKWTAVTAGIPQAGASVTEINQRIELVGRGHLNTAQQFNPLAVPEDGLRIRGQWTFVSNDDLLQILTRSDGTPGGGYGETNNGVEFSVAAAGAGNNMSIGGRGGAGVINLLGTGPLDAVAGETYDFEILDDGLDLTFNMQQVGGFKHRTVTAASMSLMPTNLVTFHNRESGRVSYLDNVVIDSPTPVPVNAPGALLADDFNDNSIDGAKWSVVTAGIPQDPKSVTEIGRRMLLEGRAHLNTAQQFNPAAMPQDGLRIRGQWTFLSGDDLLQILTRSDGTPGGGYGETNAGVEFQVGSGAMTIVGHGAAVGDVSGAGLLSPLPGETYDFEILDNGMDLSFTMRQVGGLKQRTVTAASTSAMGNNLVTFHNRESGRLSAMDNVVLDSPAFQPLAAPGALLADDFNDNSIDPAKWNVVTAGIPQDPKSVVEQNHRMELEGRAHLNTVQQFDPAAQAGDGLRIRGRWTFVSNDDFMQILTRSDGTPGGGYGETNAGVEFLVAAAGGGNNMSIGGRGGAAVQDVFSTGALGASAGETYDLEIRDNGQTLMLNMQQVGGNKGGVVYATSPSVMGANLVTFHNRESGRRSNLDNVIIDSPAPYVLDGAGALLADDFNDNALDPAKWTTDTNIPQGSVIVREANQHIEIQGRGHLNTAQQFDPASAGGDGLRIRGQWTFLTGDDFLQILTRSDGTPGGGYGETNNGVEFLVTNTGDMTVQSRGGAAVTNVVNNGALGRLAGETYDFEIRDDGQYLLFTMSQVGGNKQRAVMAQSTSALATNLVTFHNREGGGNRAALDNVVIDAAPSHVPIFDDFNDGRLDGSKWIAVTGGVPAGAAVEEINGGLQLSQRGHLDTLNQYDPLTAPADGVLVRGQWTFGSGDDFMQVLTRSDGTPGGDYGETNSGLEFLVTAAGGGNNMTIQGRGGAAVTGVVNAGALDVQAGETYNFEIRDNGNNLFFTMRQVGGAKQRTVIAASNSAMSRDFVTFHNREGGGRFAILDNLSVTSPASNVPDFGTVLLRDRFDDNSIDPGLWNVVTAGIPQDPKSVIEQDQRVRLEGRAHLNTAQQFDPVALGGMTLRGRWTFQSGDDFMQILTRSDGTPGGGYGETNNGVQFLANQTGTSDNVTISGQGAAAVGGTIPASQFLLAGETYDFQIVDDGHNLALTMKQVGGPKAAVALATSDSVMASNLITFHNRESGRLSHLDDVVLVDGIPSPQAKPFAPQGFLVRQVTSSAPVTNLAAADDLLGGMNALLDVTRPYGDINFFDAGGGGGNGLFGNDLPFPIDTSGDDNDFALSVTGQIMIPEDGSYLFGVNSDDGNRLRIDGMDIIVDDTLRGAHSIYGYADLTAGLHDLELTYFERNGGAELEMSWYNGAGQLALLSVPEPASLVLLALASLGLAAARVLRRRRAP